jgi:hypothetical protein
LHMNLERAMAWDAPARERNQVSSSRAHKIVRETAAIHLSPPFILRIFCVRRMLSHALHAGNCCLASRCPSRSRCRSRGGCGDGDAAPVGRAERCARARIHSAGCARGRRARGGGGGGARARSLRRAVQAARLCDQPDDPAARRAGGALASVVLNFGWLVGGWVSWAVSFFLCLCFRAHSLTFPSSAPAQAISPNDKFYLNGTETVRITLLGQPERASSKAPPQLRLPPTLQVHATEVVEWELFPLTSAAGTYCPRTRPRDTLHLHRFYAAHRPRCYTGRQDRRHRGDGSVLRAFQVSESSVANTQRVRLPPASELLCMPADPHGCTPLQCSQVTAYVLCVCVLLTCNDWQGCSACRASRCTRAHMTFR